MTIAKKALFAALLCAGVILTAHGVVDDNVWLLGAAGVCLGAFAAQVAK